MRISPSLANKATSPDETMNAGHMLGQLLLQQDEREISAKFSCVVIRGDHNSGKSTFLYGLVSAFIHVSRAEFANTQHGGLPRIFKKESSRGLIISYDAKTYARNPSNLFEHPDNPRVLCIEHPDRINLEGFGVTPNYAVDIQKEQLTFNAARLITINKCP